MKLRNADEIERMTLAELRRAVAVLQHKCADLLLDRAGGGHPDDYVHYERSAARAKRISRQVYRDNRKAAKKVRLHAVTK